MPTPPIVAEVALDDAIRRVLDYAVPEAWMGRLTLGMRVKVPVRNTLRSGTIVQLKEKSAYDKLLELQEVLSEKNFLPHDLFLLAQWISDYYCTPLDKVIKIMLPVSVRGKTKAKEQQFLHSQLPQTLLQELCSKLRGKSPRQAEVLDVMLRHPKGILLSQLLSLTNHAASSIETLVKRKVLQSQKGKIDRSLLTDADYFPSTPKVLNEEQRSTLSEITTSLDAHRFEVRLIHGITGSGKTEIYLQAIEHALRHKKGVIFLVPEIALTAQMIEKLKMRFATEVAILHSGLSAGERHDAWHRLQEGQASIAIGARSAIFCPIPNLGLIIVDEEHEPSYKQIEEAPLYNARDVAIVRGKLTQATVLLGSATPSLESYHNALKGKYQLSTLQYRADQAQLPQVRIVDMQKEFDKAKGFALFSDPLLTGIKERIDKGEQVLLFLNRRGYHTALFCAQCRKSLQCPHCAVHLTFHLSENTLSCHLCDHRISPPPKECPSCCTGGMLKFKGAGTEMVERALHALFPEVRTLRLDADTTRHKGSHALLFKQFRAGKADVLIGTQMVAKGLHFPAVTLVGILYADGGLQVPDFRSSECAFQLLTQVAGRAGRGALQGEVILQTHLPDHPVITLAKEQDYAAFFAQEIATRELFHYPPFTRLVKVLFKGKKPMVVLQRAQELRQELIEKLPPEYELLPVVPCGYAKIKEEYRFQFLVKGTPLAPLLSLLKERSGFIVDVDPTSTFF